MKKYIILLNAFMCIIIIIVYIFDIIIAKRIENEEIGDNHDNHKNNKIFIKLFNQYLLIFILLLFLQICMVFTIIIN
jgi:NADH:ubiquinone oxidoreductase subunit 6 (subunit J)